MVFGTSDAALRLFSLVCAFACLPLLWSLGVEVGGRSGALASVVLFSISPVAVYYSTEGRMYALLFLCSAGTLAATSSLTRHSGAWRWSAWVVVSIVGLLTHYFFAFVWLAALAYLAVCPGNCSRRAYVVGVSAIVLSVLPWYATIPETMAAWRVRGGWLELEPWTAYSALRAHLELPWSLLSIRGVWGVGSRANAVKLLSPA